MKVTLLGKSLYRYQVMMRSLGIAHIQHDQCPYKKEKFGFTEEQAVRRQTQRKDSHVKTVAEIRVLLPLSKKLEEAKKDSPPELSEREFISWHFDLGLLVSRTVRE